LFYGCSDYPTCTFVSWNKPVSEPCPVCGSFMVEKKYRNQPAAVECSNSACSSRVGKEPESADEDLRAEGMGAKATRVKKAASKTPAAAKSSAKAKPKTKIKPKSNSTAKVAAPKAAVQKSTEILSKSSKKATNKKKTTKKIPKP